MAANSVIDLNPKGNARLPRGVHPCREYQVFDHERGAWVHYQEYLYETAMGCAHIVVAPGKDMREGMAAADRLLQAESATTILEPGLYGTVNSIRNHSDLYSGAPLTLALARSGAYTEWGGGRILEVFTGGGQVQPSRLQRTIANRPALAFPYQPFAGNSYRRIKPGNTPCGGRMKFATPFGAARNELFLAGRIVNRWSEVFYRSVLANVSYDLWIAEGEMSALCLSLLPLLLGLKMDVVGIPGARMWSCQQGPDCWKLAPELEVYCFKGQGGAHRRVGLLLDQDRWRNLKVADALLRLCKALRGAGASVLVAITPPEFRPKGIDEFMAKHCVHENILNFGPLLDVMEHSVVVDQDYAVNYPSPEMSWHLKSLTEQAQAFREVQEKFRDRDFGELPSETVEGVVADVGRLLSADETDGAGYLEEFQALPRESQALRWAEWMFHNPFQTELDHQLDPFIPGIFRGRGSEESRSVLGLGREGSASPRVCGEA